MIYVRIYPCSTEYKYESFSETSTVNWQDEIFLNYNYKKKVVFKSISQTSIKNHLSIKIKFNLFIRSSQSSFVLLLSTSLYN